MSAEPSSSIITVDNKPVNNDSDYDEGLDIPDETQHGVTFSSDEKDGEDQEPVTALPFKTVHNTPVKFKAPVRKVFIPNQKIELQIIDHERSVTSHILNPYLYTIELVHGSFSWTIKKRYKHFQLLHSQLKIYRATLNIPFPTKTHRERRTSFKHDLNRTKRSAGGLPRFPAKPDGLIPEEQIESRIQELQEYLKALLRIPLYRNHHETLAFLEVSELSFVGGLGGMGGKGKEGAILKRTRSTRPAASAQCNLCGLMDAALCVRCQFVCGDVCGAWRNRWLLVKDSCVAYVRPRDGRLRCVMLFDAAFEVSSGLFSTGLRRGLHITNACRQITIKCPTRRTTREWMAYIKDSAHKIGFSSQCRYTSFAPVRDAEVSRAAWLVDGRSYMAAVADAMEAAREEIYIADWWLSPEIHMKRPALHGDYWRLDHIIRRKAEHAFVCAHTSSAEAGVKIFLLLYKEVEIALGINSFYSKQTIAKCHPENVKVLRHPDHTKAGVFLWAHHEKVVVVDQSVAFVGGIDLCYGRWDDHHHRLTDLGSIKHRDSSVVITAESAALAENAAAAATTAEQSSIVSLVKMTNSLSVGVVKLSSQSDDSMKIVNDTNNPAEPNTSEMNGNVVNEPGPENYKGDTPEMQRKNILSKMKENVRNRGREWKTFLFTSDEDEDDDNDEDGDKDKTHHDDDVINDDVTDDGTDCSSRITQQTADVGDGLIEDGGKGPATAILKDFEGLTGSAKLWYGKDYTNFIVKDFDNLDLPFQDLVDRSQTPRMPWHDIGACVVGAPARDVARHFIERWNAIKLEKAKTNPCYPYLLPKSYSIVQTEFEFITTRTYQVSCQVVRSVSQWSAGFLDSETWEASIHEAYVGVIGRARHYVYIENQFFITAVSSAASPVRNQVGDALYKRILRAHRERKTFRVYVVIPLLPGFEGEVGTPTGTALHAITHWNYASISRGKDSLIARLKAAGVAQPDDYISFHGLRTHSVLNGKLVSELIYVHSKLLIADDRVAIIGSANINDRSLLGKRDSEIAVVIEDERFTKTEWDGVEVEVGHYCGSLRRRLFREHLGLLESTSVKDNRSADVGQGRSTSLMDPIGSQFYDNVWRATARANTDIYEQVFQCIPSDKVTCFDALKRRQYETPLAQSDPDAAVQLLQNVKGHLVMLPLEFLSNEVLTPNPNTVTGMMPTSLWT